MTFDTIVKESINSSKNLSVLPLRPSGGPSSGCPACRWLCNRTQPWLECSSIECFSMWIVCNVSSSRLHAAAQEAEADSDSRRVKMSTDKLNRMQRIRLETISVIKCAVLGGNVAP